MNILIAGASGLIGQELIRGLSSEHHFTLLGRHKDLLKQVFSGRILSVSWDELNTLDAHQFDAVINLSGHNIAASRWTPFVKEEIINSRVHTTEKLVDWILKQKAKPHIYCANAVGIYGLQENGDATELDEDTPIDFEHPKDFLSEIGVRWQQALAKAEKAGLAVTSTRFGVVLKKGEGFLGRLYPSFITGFGSVIGNGKQYLSWVDSQDLVNAYRFLLNHPNITGPVNITSPNPCMQKDFAKAYAKSLHRPLLFLTPAFVIHFLFGEMGDCLINQGQKVVPKRLLEAGFEFKWPTIQSALKHIANSKPSWAEEHHG
ncbi:TIGR01777 family oxidoreductase [Legionella shakespearei]|uniref:Nucleoside-diphosphate sugar epimerase n=1 Tax=Legionella shakespearei DSM 23087 TaxID=1122169 RepID=A0A0W0YZJ0_9GAMM|nr:TIGR01777 family oxidoreductase [Legionella shakespearei]KTD62297.1 nucleoside-diphosphate sugar epimerase [Legionella shakespearei DSM 23087]